MPVTVSFRSAAWRRLLATETKLFLREPMALFWGVLFPLVLIVVFGVTGGYPEGKLGGQSLVDVYVPVMMVFVLTVVAAQVLPAILASYREKGVLRRMSTTPIQPVLLLGADVAVLVTVIVTALLVIAIVARLAFNVHLPTQGFGFVITLALAAVAMLGVGRRRGVDLEHSEDRECDRDVAVLPDDVLRGAVGAEADDAERAAARERLHPAGSRDRHSPGQDARPVARHRPSRGDGGIRDRAFVRWV